MKYITSIPHSPAAVGPYSPAVEVNGLIFLSGQIPLDPTTMKIVSEEIEEQATQVMKNIQAVLTHLSLSFREVAKTTIFLTDLSHFDIVNKVYSEFMGESRPARSTIQVAALPKGAKVEIEMIAVRQGA